MANSIGQRDGQAADSILLLMMMDECNDDEPRINTIKTQ